MSEQEILQSLIRQLPPEISNKIAAGEVVQRPASVVKELLDNAVDSGADSIKIIVENAGRTLIQVIDNGCGMSEADLKVCFKRHATSKINAVDDLFRIRTLGFRGEALASIASVSQVLVRTKRVEDESGFEMVIWGGEEREPVPAATDDGTSVSIRNLFFNVPARRQFLKTDATELRHILRTVQYAALANTDIAFRVVADMDEIYNLPVQSLEDRIAAIFGTAYKASLIRFEEETSYGRIYGYASDPKLAKKSRGEQFLFVNGRPFQHRYLTHVLLSLYDAWTRNNEYPFYAVFLEVDPNSIDVNVHPSKMEVKFEDERSIIQLAKSVVNQALNKHFMVPGIAGGESVFLSDEQRTEFSRGLSFSGRQGPAGASSGYHFPSRINKPPVQNRGDVFAGKIYGEASYPKEENKEKLITRPDAVSQTERSDGGFWQLHNTYIVTQTRNGLCLIDQHLAHKRVIYEKALTATEQALPSTQQLLFAQTSDLSASEYALLKELHPILKQMGFAVQLLSGNSVMITGVPADIEIGNEQEVLVEMLQQYRELGQKLQLEAREKLAISFASKAAIARGKKLSQQEMEALFDQLFACEQPYLDPLQKPTIVYLSLDEIQSGFR